MTINHSKNLSSMILVILVMSSLTMVLGDTPPRRDMPTLNITGVVTDDGDQELSGATCWLIVHEWQNAYPKIDSQTTDETGRFRFELAGVDPLLVTVLVYKPGYSLGVKELRYHASPDALGRDLLALKVETHMNLTKGHPLKLRILDSQGQPIAHGRLQLVALPNPESGHGDLIWFDHTIPELERTPAAHGDFELDYLPAQGRLYLRLNVADGSSQLFKLQADKRRDCVVLQLQPTVEVNLTLVHDDPAEYANRALKVTTSPISPMVAASKAGDDATIAIGGSAMVRTDSTGKAKATVPAGRIQVTTLPRPGSRDFPLPSVTEARAGDQAVEMRVQFERGVHVTGCVMTPDDQPVAGVKIQFLQTTTVTGEDGKYELYVPQRELHLGRIVDVPSGWSWPMNSTLSGAPFSTPAETIEDDQGSLTVKLAPVIIRKSVPVSGTVLDESGTPVPDVQVTAAWAQRHDVHNMMSRRTDVALTDKDGRFVLQHVFPDVEVQLTARSTDAAILKPRTIQTNEPHDLSLTITPQGLIRIVGRVRGSDGSAIPDAVIQIASALTTPRGWLWGGQDLTNSGGRHGLTTDEDGRFVMPAMVPRFGRYSIVVSASGYQALETPFMAPPESGSDWDINELVLTKARSATGVVRDSKGKAVFEAEVSTFAARQGRRLGTDRVVVETDREGRFQLNGVHPHAMLAMVRKDGFRLNGFPLMNDSASMSVILYREDEPIPEDHAVHPAEFPRDDYLRAARRLVDAMGPKVRDSSYFHDIIVTMLMRFDKDAAMQALRHSESAKNRAVVLAQVGEDVDAIAEVEAIADPYSRAWTRFGILDFLDDQEARELISAALLDAQAMRDPVERISIMTEVAAQLAERGDAARAEEILRKERTTAQSLGQSEIARVVSGNFATQLVRFDHAAALDLIQSQDEQGKSRFYRDMAEVAAAGNPEIAEEILERIGFEYGIDSAVLHRLASTDLPRAIRLLNQVDGKRLPNQRALGLGMIAHAIKNSEPDRAKIILRQAFDAQLEHAGHARERNDSKEMYHVTFTLLYLAEAIDPEHLTDYFWQTVDRHGGPEAESWSPDQAQAENASSQAQLALLLALYDTHPDLATQIMEPVFAYWEDQIGEKSYSFDAHAETFMAMALIDPDRAVDWAIRFREQLDGRSRDLLPQPWQVIGNTLTRDRRAVQQSIIRDVFHGWLPDDNAG